MSLSGLGDRTRTIFLFSFDIYIFASSQTLFLIPKWKFLYISTMTNVIHPSITAYSALKVGGGAWVHLGQVRSSLQGWLPEKNEHTFIHIFGQFSQVIIYPTYMPGLGGNQVLEEHPNPNPDLGIKTKTFSLRHKTTMLRRKTTEDI